MQNRLLSLDVFRGMTVAMMILVNNPGDWGHVYAPLLHAHWHGCTPTDLVFPFFLFIVGVSIAFAFGKSEIAMSKIFRRSAILFGLGFFLSFYPKFDIEHVRIMGVLQRIGLVYLFTSIIYLKIPNQHHRSIATIILLAYWVLLAVVPVPNIGPANLEPTTNLTAWFDRSLLTEAHLYKGVDGQYDPEGLLSTLPAIVTCLFGTIVGRFLKQHRHDKSVALKLITMGIVATLAGWFWGQYFPINKALWTSSYVLFAGGLATIMFAACYYVIDVMGYRKWALFFEVYGVNAIVVFFFSGFIPRTLGLWKISTFDGAEVSSQKYFQDTFIGSHFADPYQASLAVATFHITFWFIVLYIMYKRKIFVKI